MISSYAEPKSNHERHLELEGLYNFRDIGGYRTEDGKTTRWGRFYRSDSLQNLTAQSRQQLFALGLQTIIDLRRLDEMLSEPDAIADDPTIHYYHLPIFSAPIASTTHSPLPNIQSLADVYVGTLDHFSSPVKTIFEQIAQSADNPLLVHCTVGKDRTGVIIALLLDLARVPAETIIADYIMTGALASPLIEELRQKAILTGLDLDRNNRMLECKPEYMEATVNHLHTVYGGAEAYLRGIGLKDHQLQALKLALVE